MAHLFKKTNCYRQERCNQMARSFAQYLAIYNSENLPNSIKMV